MRDVYYQSPGNPIQVDRLPKSRPEIEMPPPLKPLGARLAEVARTLITAIAVAVGAVLLYRLAGPSWLEPYDLLFAGLVILAAFIHTLVKGLQGWVCHPLVLLAILLLCLNARIPWIVQCLLLSASMGAFVYFFGSHWAHVCTAVARSLRLQWQRQLGAIAALGALLIAGLLLSDWLILKIAIVTLPVAALLTPGPKGLGTSRWQVIRDSLLSWITYEARPLPGLLQSPAGPVAYRRAMTVFAAVMTAIVLTRWDGSPLPALFRCAIEQHQSITQQLDSNGADIFERIRYGLLPWAIAVVVTGSLPVVIPCLLAIALATPILMEAAANRDQAKSVKGTQTLLADIRTSPDPREKDSIYLGRVVADGSPVLVPRKVFGEHAHVLGDTGSGKTALFLCPIMEQLATRGDCSVIVLDLKADTLELLATLQAAAETVWREKRLRIPIKTFSNQAGMATFAFNPLTQPFWPKLDLLTRTDILCAANGLTYGTDYGPYFYSTSNAAVSHRAYVTNPNVKSFKEFAECIGHVIFHPNKGQIHPEIRKAGVHVHEVMKRLAACEPLNVTESSGHTVDVVEQAIDLTQVFQQPQFIYGHLSATLSPSAAPEIARLFTYMLLAAATQTKRSCPVVLVIDEFQRMVAANLEYMLQLARSMGVSVILANQSMEDLKKSTTNHIPTIEANCRLRQWLSVSSTDDQDRLIHSSGETVDRAISRSVTTNSEGKTSKSYSETEQVVNRFCMNDVLRTNDHPFKSFLRISRGDGYAQYGGLPVIVESSYHISPEEYGRRKDFPWPEGSGTFVPRGDDGQNGSSEMQPTPTPSGPEWTEETIGNEDRPLSEDDQKAIKDLFEKFQAPAPSKAAPTRRRRK
jgi:hypothetical protein